MRCPASLRLSIASSRTVSSSAMKRVYGQAASSDHPIILPSPASSPTSAERSRAMSLATSFGSCGPTYATLRVPPSERVVAAKRAPERRESPLGLRAGPARGGTGITRAAIPGGPDGFLGQQPHGVGLRQRSGQPPQVPLQVRTVPLLEAPLQPRQQVPRPLRDAYLFDQLIAMFVHRAVILLSVCATSSAPVASVLPPKSFP